MTTPTFDMNTALKALREGKDLTGKATGGAHSFIGKTTPQKHDKTN
ncbi:MAG: hypothetical protein KAG53_06425 [Endozoicomonadaceae bacterium]|nr:hypothetical protein [Endozoicomonadaceae bacterium]